MADKKAVKRTSSGSPHRRNPELYFGHVYIEREMFNMVKLFAYWHHISTKSAAHQLIKFGLQYYAEAILKAERARQLGKEVPKPEFFSYGAITNYIKTIKKKEKELPKIPAQEENNPLGNQ